MKWSFGLRKSRLSCQGVPRMRLALVLHALLVAAVFLAVALLFQYG